MSYTSFKRIVWAHYRKHGRHDLSWRKTRNPYKILVSEVMLQQTQVERVVPFYRDFLRDFPTVKKLAAAPLSQVLKRWQGLGYNRRAKMLHAAAKEIAENGMPETASELEKLPGVGPYTARAVVAFAFDESGVFIETNIRTAVVHHFFAKKSQISDKEIAQILREALPKKNVREWYLALMDYGAYLKRSGVRTNARSKHYVKQSRFGGSSRQARGAILRELAKGGATKRRLLGLLGDDRTEQLASALGALVKEGLVAKRATRFALSD